MTNTPTRAEIEAARVAVRGTPVVRGLAPGTIGLLMDSDHIDNIVDVALSAAAKARDAASDPDAPSDFNDDGTPISAAQRRRYSVADTNQRTIEDLSQDSKDILLRIQVYISGMYGDRCLTREHGCRGYELWAVYDLFETMLMSDET